MTRTHFENPATRQFEKLLHFSTDQSDALSTEQSENLHNRTVNGLLVLIGAWRLSLCRIRIPRATPSGLLPEHELYEKLVADHGEDAYRLYNSLIRRLVSLESALEHQLRARDFAPLAKYAAPRMMRAGYIWHHRLRDAFNPSTPKRSPPRTIPDHSKLAECGTIY